MITKAFVFDFDDTLATTQASVLVIGPSCCGGYIMELSPAEFNTYQLKEGERFDFSEFRCPDLIEKSVPTDLITLAQDVHSENHDVYILTARSDDVVKAIAKFLYVHKIKAKQIICLGDKDESDSIAQAKRKVLKAIMDTYDKIYFYDDNKKNIQLAKSIGVKSYLV